MRFVFSPPADEAAGLLTLPFGVPLEQWEDERLVEIRQRGLSRHVVRFVAEGGELYALKALSERLARREYRLLRALAELNVPAVEVVGIVVDRGPDLDAILVTRFLEYSTTYRALFSRPRVGQPTDRLLDALVDLLGRLLAVEHAVPLRRGNPRGLPGRRGDQRAASRADRRAAELGRRARGRAGQR
jgi:aminoglycoside phosphotransferase (APT) family kinase protein